MKAWIVVVLLVCYFIGPSCNVSPNPQGVAFEVVHMPKDRAHEAMGKAYKELDKESFKQVVQIMLSDSSDDLQSIDICLTYITAQRWCDCLPLFDAAIERIGRRGNSRWNVPMGQGSTKAYGFNDSTVWEDYYSSLLKPRREKLTRMCSEL